MMGGGSAPQKDPEQVRREQELLRQQQRQEADIEKERIKSMRGRGGAMSLFSGAGNTGTQLGQSSTLG